ncbi:MAG: hypothetical protein KF726_05930 [Anaerolineae bacterium]|nr:hypothetical protein [Anaerolineae bacterium]
MASTLDPDLEALRRTVERQQWMEAFELLSVVLEKLPPRRIVQLSAVQMKAALPAFEELRTKLRWTRQAIELMSNGDPLPDDFEFGQEAEGANPIVTNFMIGLDKLDAAASEQDDPHVCANNGTRAILSAISARRYHYFSRLFPRDWRIVVKREAGVKDLPPIKSKFLEESAVEEFTTGLWRSLVEQIKDALAG